MIQPSHLDQHSDSHDNTTTAEQPVRHQVAVAAGDGIGSEITEAVLQVLTAAGAPIAWEPVELGATAYQNGHQSGISRTAWQTIRRNGVLLKGPVTTPQGGGFKSVNVTLRKSLNLFANVRPVQALTPFVASVHPDMDVVVIRENEEDLYAGIEHRQTPEVHQVLKLVTRPGCERIIRYAFAYAQAQGRRRVSCMSKDNIMKLTDGLFHSVFDEVAAEYPAIEADHHIIDIGAARLADRPEQFDVIVTLNLYGDIISDIAAEIAGSVGMAASSNIGTTAAMFEAIHGSAPDIAGQGIANPSGMLLAATQMLVHLGEGAIAERIANAWRRTLEDGIHTKDIRVPGTTLQTVGTKAFAEAVIARLDQLPRQLPVVRYHDQAIEVPKPTTVDTVKRLVGVDVFLDWDQDDRDPEQLGYALGQLAGDDCTLDMITNRGIKVFPDGLPETACTDHWRCRFLLEAQQGDYLMVIGLMQRLTAAGFEVIKSENLYTFDGKPGFSAGQGQ